MPESCTKASQSCPGSSSGCGAHSGSQTPRLVRPCSPCHVCDACALAVRFGTRWQAHFVYMLRVETLPGAHRPAMYTPGAAVVAMGLWHASLVPFPFSAPSLKRSLMHAPAMLRRARARGREHPAKQCCYHSACCAALASMRMCLCTCVCVHARLHACALHAVLAPAALIADRAICVPFPAVPVCAAGSRGAGACAHHRVHQGEGSAAPVRARDLSWILRCSACLLCRVSLYCAGSRGGWGG